MGKSWRGNTKRQRNLRHFLPSDRNSSSTSSDANGRPSGKKIKQTILKNRENKIQNNGPFTPFYFIVEILLERYQVDGTGYLPSGCPSRPSTKLSLVACNTKRTLFCFGKKCDFLFLPIKACLNERKRFCRGPNTFRVGPLKQFYFLLVLDFFFAVLNPGFR